MVEYCNNVLYSISEVYRCLLQSVLNVVARLIAGKRKFDDITNTICDDLHRLPVRQCILYELCTLVGKCLRHDIPSYLIDLCITVSATTASLMSTFVLTL